MRSRLCNPVIYRQYLEIHVREPSFLTGQCTCNIAENNVQISTLLTNFIIIAQYEIWTIESSQNLKRNISMWRFIIQMQNATKLKPFLFTQYTTHTSNSYNN